MFLSRREFIENDRSLEEYEHVFDRDYYATHPNGTGEYFNYASVSLRSDAVSRVARETYVQQELRRLSDDGKLALIREAREKAARLLNVTEEGVVIGRNTTHVMSLFRWLADHYDASVLGGLTPSALLTDVENMATYRMVRFIGDEGNPRKRDNLTTYSSHPSYVTDPVRMEKPGMTLVEILQSRGRNIEDMRRQIRAKMRRWSIPPFQATPPEVLFLSHVSREDGRVFDVASLAAEARSAYASAMPKKQSLFTVIDGAQAMGNLPKIDFAATGADFYVSSPHKTLGSEPLGLGYIDPSNPRLQSGLARLRDNDLDERVRPTIVRGMFHEDVLGPNVDQELNYGDLAGFNVAIHELRQSGWLEGNDFGRLHEHRARMSAMFEEKLLSTRLPNGWSINFVRNDKQSSFIKSFTLDRSESIGRRLVSAWSRYDVRKDVAQRLDAAGVHLTYLHEPCVFRVSFDRATTPTSIAHFLHTLHQVLGELK